MRDIELLIPASCLEVLKTAVIFGADAVYIGGEAFGLRAKAKNFSKEDMAEGIGFAHKHGVKVYVTANILAHNYDLDGVREYFRELGKIKPDALIISDPGVFTIAKEVLPDMELHVSTQANNTNYMTYRFWQSLGAKRVVSARELSLREIKEIRENIPDDLEIETIGPKFENNPIFPDRVNTEFIQVLDRNTVKMRVWERGSGETFACGTGACATVVACVLNGLTDDKVTVKLLGGDLFIEYNREENTVYMTGPAKVSFTGKIEV